MTYCRAPDGRSGTVQLLRLQRRMARRRKLLRRRNDPVDPRVVPNQRTTRLLVWTRRLPQYYRPPLPRSMAPKILLSGIGSRAAVKWNLKNILWSGCQHILILIRPHYNVPKETPLYPRALIFCRTSFQRSTTGSRHGWNSPV